MEEFELSKEKVIDILDWLSQRGYSLRTIEKYKQTLKKISIKYGKITNENLRKILKSFKYQNQRAVLCVINNYCFDKGISYSIIVPKLKVKPRKTPEIYSLEEIKIIIKSAPKPYDLALRCIFNMGAGLRVSEIIKLSWNHIRWPDWISNKENYGIAIIKSSKGGKERVVNIPSNLMHDLYNYAKEKNVLNEFGIPTGGMIFPIGSKHFKQDLMRNNLELWKHEYLKQAYNWFRYNVIQAYCEKALGKKIRVHSLRHSRATYLYEIEKVPIERIQLLLGHSDLSTTMIYTKVNPLSTFEMLKKTQEL